MVIAAQLMTADDLLRLPDDGFRTELVRGELRRMSPASHQHGRSGIRVSGPLDRYVDENGLGAVYAAETGFRVASNPDTVLAPDVAFVRQERVDEIGDSAGNWPGAPDHAVGIVPRHGQYTEVGGKVIDWQRALRVVYFPLGRFLRPARGGIPGGKRLLAVARRCDGDDVRTGA